MSDNSDGVAQGVVELVSAGVPADQGLSSLALLMQLTGSITAAYAAVMAFMMLFAAGGGSDLTIWAVLIGAVCVTRSMFHRAAGSELLYGRAALAEPDAAPQPLRGVHRYIRIALLQTVLLGAIVMFKFHVSLVVAVALGIGLAVWPITLAILCALPRFARFRHALPPSEDKGFEGVAILMTILGAIGACVGATVLALMLGMGGQMLQEGPVVLLLITVVLLVVRSIIHVQAGISGLRAGHSVDRAAELANRYANFGIISSFCAGGVMLLLAMTTHLAVSGLAMVTGVCWMLMAWPLIVRRFFSDRQQLDLLAGEHAPVHRRAPDAGLTGLGWLLIAGAAGSAAITLPQLLLAYSEQRGSIAGLFALASLGDRSAWWTVGEIMLQGWAGYELVRMSPQHRIITNVYGAVSVAVSIYLAMPMVTALRHGGGRDLGDLAVASGGGLTIGLLVMSVMVPVATLLLVNRTLAPTARARFRTR